MSAEAHARPDSWNIEVHKSASTRFAEMEAHLSALVAHYGPDHPGVHKALYSYARSVGRIMAFPMGDTQVFSDSARLSLYVITGGIHMGVIFHADRRGCVNEGCRAFADDDGHVWFYNPEHPSCDDHAWSYPLDAPALGTWSTHT